MSKIEVVIIEDDQLVFLEMKHILAGNYEYYICNASTGSQALQIIELVESRPLIVILDLGLPDMGGLEVMKAISFRPQLAIVVVTAHADQQTRLSSLAGGADAFITKPFDAEELLLTLAAVKRRVFPEFQPQKPNRKWRLIPRQWSLVAPNGKSIRLTVIETQLLDLLHRHKGKSVTRGRIGLELGNLYRYSGNALEATVSRLRRKIAAVDDSAELVKAVSGVGYTLSQDVE